MIGGISPISAVPPIEPVRGVSETQAVFSIPKSALRTNDVTPTQGVAERDPVADSVELSRDFPQMLISPTYAPLPAEQTLAFRRGTGVEEADDEAAGDYSGIEELPVDAEEGEEGDVDEAGEPGKEKSAGGQELDEAEQQQVRELKARDAEVRAHEQAHKSVGGSYAGGISYEYQQGPDGNKYAVGGEVSIDTSAERDPAATIAKMRVVKAAAMAPAEPSGQDRSVAAQASQTEMQARQELAEQQRAESAEESEGSGESERTDGSAASETDGAARAESGRGTAETAADGRITSGSDPASDRSVSGVSSNRFAGRYAESAYSAQAFGASLATALSGYSPIDIVA